MGIDLLDLTFRVEREFDIEIPRDDLVELLSNGNTVDPPNGAWTDIRVSDFVALVETKIDKRGRLPETDVYDRVRKHIVDCLDVNEAEVHPETWPGRDLGME